MKLLRSIWYSNFFIRLRSWEYWPFGVVQFPLMIYWLWLSLKARSLFFFSASNPSILLGGMFGESKYDILKRMPERLLPKTRFVRHATSRDQLLSILNEDFTFPVIFKPDIGERGFRVKRINSNTEAEEYLNSSTGDFIIQELIDLPVECGVFYTRFPDNETGKVTSLVLKEMLAVTGNGHSTLQELIFNHERAKLQWERLKITFVDRLNSIPEEDEVIELNPIGNHCLGTKFLNGNKHIDDELSASFDAISKAIGEFYFGRFDLKCASLDDLRKGRVKILEVNGCGAEPAHIYHPGFPLLKAWQTLFVHWKNLYRISTQNHKRGIPYTSTKEGIQIYRKFNEAIKGNKKAPV
ncbi:MAG: hypothetical protein KF803_05990 [Cyclobacteriaceae bacterium]|nr:hypothetical protein [Cyclobacteriaceae bacterium]